MPAFETARSSFLWDATAVPNAFFCEYMPTAPENHVKISLYGLMCAHGGLPEDENLLYEMAQVLRLDLKQIETAMRYWERCRLVERISDKPLRYRFVAVQQVLVQRQQMPEDEEYEAFGQAVTALFGDRRKIHGKETALAFEWVEDKKLPQEVVLMLLQHMIVTNGINFSFAAAEKRVAEMLDQKILSIEDAEIYFEKSEAAKDGVKKVLRHLGMTGRNPTKDEMDLYMKWTLNWGFEPKSILQACKETTKIGSPNLSYLDKVLEGIYNRTSGKATSEEKVQAAIAENQAETAQIRELLQTLGISFAAIDDGLRLEYRDMAAQGGHELVMLAAREVVRRTRVHTLDKVKQYLDGWRKLGLTAAAAVQSYLADIEKMNEELRGLMEIAGTGGGATKANRDLLAKWQTEWRMPPEMIRLAAELARGKKDVMKYMNKLLEG